MQRRCSPGRVAALMARPGSSGAAGARGAPRARARLAAASILCGSVALLAPRARAEPFIVHELLRASESSMVSVAVMGTADPDRSGSSLTAQLGGAFRVARSGIWLDVGAPVGLGSSEGWLRSSVDEITLGLSADLLEHRRARLSLGLDSMLPLASEDASALPAGTPAHLRPFLAMAAPRGGTLTARAWGSLPIGALVASARFDAELEPAAPASAVDATAGPAWRLRPSAGLERDGDDAAPGFGVWWSGEVAPAPSVREPSPPRVDLSVWVPLPRSLDLVIGGGSSFPDPRSELDLFCGLRVAR